MGQHRSTLIDLIIAAVMVVVVAEDLVVVAAVPSIHNSNNEGTIVEVKVGNEAMTKDQDNLVDEEADIVAVAAVECLFYNIFILVIL